MLAALSSVLHKALVIVGIVYLMAVILTVLVLSIASFFIYRALRLFLQFRTPRHVECPEINDFAIIQIDALRATATGILDSPALRVRACSRWPEHENCDRACLHGMKVGAGNVAA
jgi:hypothetical protein